MSTVHRFGPFEFATDSGELRRTDQPRAEPQRLSPQPALLLALLLEHRGELVERETIRRRLWPDVNVDFDSNLHFCVRQIRAALGETADEPRYIETLPRRGYRFASEATGATEPVQPAPPSGKPGFQFGVPHAVILLLLLLTLAWVGGFFERSVEAPVRIGILSFRHVAADGSVLGEGIAEAILEGLMERDGPALELIGPTTTERYASDADSLIRMGEEHDLGFVLNARYVGDGPALDVLAELIRLPDGAHVWVERYRDLADADAIARDVTAGLGGWIEARDEE